MRQTERKAVYESLFAEGNFRKTVDLAHHCAVILRDRPSTLIYEIYKPLRMMRFVGRQLI